MGTAPVAISANEARGAQVATSPLTNAAKYTPPGGGTAGCPDPRELPAGSLRVSHVLVAAGSPGIAVTGVSSSLVSVTAMAPQEPPLTR